MNELVDNLQQLHFLRPQWLWALALLPLAAWAWRRRRLQRSAWREAVDPHLLPHLLEAQPPRRERMRWWPALLAATLAVLALAGPSWQRAPQPLWQVRAPLVLALDLSGTMLAGDLPPSRLARARAKLASVLRERTGGQVGLLVYSADAYVVAPLTDDAANVALFLDALAPDIMPGDAQASEAGAAIDRAVQLMRQAGFDHGDILVFSDHAGAAAITAAKAAAAAGYRVSALGFGTPAGAPWRDAAGNIAHASLHAASLRALAAAGSGRYAAVASDDSDLAAIGVLESGAPGAVAKQGQALSLWRDQGYWLLLPLLLLVPLGFRRNGVFAALALCLCLPWQPPAQAAGIDWWQRADQQAHARMQQGATAYHGKDYAAAERAWHALPGADAAYNRGNALARQGRYQDAIAAYDDALRLQPGMPDALANRRAVEAAMKRRPPPAPKQGDRKGDGKDKADRGEQAGKQDRRKQDGGQGSDGEPRRGEEARAQGDGTGARPRETPAQRERRLANQAWLRRVPDDPGGLLRERFRLEHERRRQESE